MVRSILAVVLSYLAIFVMVFVALTGAYFAFGVDRAFQEDIYETSVLWNLTMAVIGFAAAIIGGVICRGIAKQAGPVRVLMMVIILMGVVNVILQAQKSPPEGEEAVRTGEVSNLEAMERAQTPLWISILNPVIGVAGVALGGLRSKQGS